MPNRWLLVFGRLFKKAGKMPGKQKKHFDVFGFTAPGFEKVRDTFQ